jgi:DNA-binding CsgD family transcriptional regulator
MTTADALELSFEQSVEHANRVASRLLPWDLGAHTNEDMVSHLIEKELRAGKSEGEIQETLQGPGLRRRLINIRNDFFRREAAKKRGGGLPRVCFEEAEPLLSKLIKDAEFEHPQIENPESEFIRKERWAYMKDVLNRLIEKAALSETQKRILRLDMEGFTSEEIARELDMDIDAVYARRSEMNRKFAAAARQIAKLEK